MTSNEGRDDRPEKKEKELYKLVDGVHIPALFEVSCGRPMQEHVDLLKNMDMRPDDVIIAAFAKAGTHWIWEVVSMLLSGKAQYEERTKEFTMMEATQFEKLEAEASPRIFNSHLPLYVLPRQIKDKKVRVIHIYRNCKDILVSAYFHFSQVEDLTLEDVEKIIRSGVPGSDYFCYMQEMDDYRKNNPDGSFFLMSYEDTKENPEKSIEKLASFLGVETTPKLILDIAEATSITKMREADRKKQQRDNIPFAQLYRKGQVGDWKNHLTVALSERLDTATTQLKSCDYHFRYTL